MYSVQRLEQNGNSAMWYCKEVSRLFGFKSVAMTCGELVSVGTVAADNTKV